MGARGSGMGGLTLGSVFLREWKIEYRGESDTGSVVPGQEMRR